VGHVQIAGVCLEAFSGLSIRIEEGYVRQRYLRCIGELNCPIEDRLRFEVELSVALPLNRHSDVLQLDAVHPDFAVRQRKEFDPKVGLRCRRDLRATVADLHIFHRNVEARKEAEAQSATDADFHSEGVEDEGLHLALCIHSKNQNYYYPDEHKNTEHSADSEQDALA